MHIKRRGLLFVLSSPSGAGKTSIAKGVLQGDTHVKLSISITTRPPRPGETDGVDYTFVSQSQFTKMIHKGELLEHAKVFGNYYGTPKAPVIKALNKGQDILFDIDWQGGQQLAEHMREDLVKVFILPPSTRDLEKRLRNRAQDSPQVVQNRMAKAADEMSHFAEYDWVIVNRDIQQAITDAKAILQSERLRRIRQSGLNDFIKTLQAGY